ncbi:MAG TPA: hypothetical protein VFV94_15170 [Polyangiaceae bacterium]|nr:hypothetical protein [Polyangiaceae bacterium]
MITGGAAGRTEQHVEAARVHGRGKFPVEAHGADRRLPAPAETQERIDRDDLTLLHERSVGEPSFVLTRQSEGLPRMGVEAALGARQ